MTSSSDPTSRSAALPSPAAERVLGLVIRHDEWREAIVGDLREEFTAMAAATNVADARRWHWQQVLRIAGRRLLGRSPVRLQRRRSHVFGEPRDQGSRLAGLQRDLAYAARSLAARPGLNGIIVLILACGLAANATMFSVLDGLVLRPFRFATVDRLIVIGSVAPQELFRPDSVAPADFLEWNEELRATTEIAGINWWEPNLVGHDEPEQLAGFAVSTGYFSTMGVPPFLGRGFLPDEGVAGRRLEVVISHGLWARRFGSDPAILGRSLRLDGDPHEVVGVAPPGFSIPYGADIWRPLVLAEEARTDRRNGYLMVIGRLAPGRSLDEARAEVESIVARQREQYPETNGKRSVTLRSFMIGMGSLAERFIVLMQLAALVLLLVACANVANLLLAQGVERQQEFAVRLALGASRVRIVRQLLLEGTALAAVAALVAAPLAWAGVAASRLTVPPTDLRFVPGWEYYALQPRGLVVMSGLAAFATLLFIVAPAFQGTRAALGDTLRRKSRTLTASSNRAWGLATLASVQIGLTLPLLTVSGITALAARAATHADKGFDPTEVLVARLHLPVGPYNDVERRQQFIDQVLERLRAVPAVRHAASTSSLPYVGVNGSNATRPFYPEGTDMRPADVRPVDFRRVTPEIFDVLRLPMVAGRGFGPEDTRDAPPVAIVSQTLADRYWPGIDPLGRRFKLAESGPFLLVVGVVADVVVDERRQRYPTIYRSSRQDPPLNLFLVIRTAGDPAALASHLRRAVSAVDPEQPIRRLATLEQVIHDDSSGIRFGAIIFSVISGIALLLALVGIYSLMAYLSNRRRQEIGVRLAFGATRWDVIRLTVAQAARITAAGLSIGLALAFAASRVMHAALPGPVPPHALLPAALAVALAVAALLASYLPAHRAAALDPATALRSE